MKKSHSTNHLTLPLFFIAAILILALGGGIAYVRYDGKATPTHVPTSAIAKKSSTTGPTIKVPSYTTQVNGQAVQVPNNVPSSDVPAYTLITQNQDYEIQELNGSYTITLYAIINNPSDSASYTQQLHQYKQEALQYLTQHGVNINNVSITYDPSQAAQD